MRTGGRVMAQPLTHYDGLRATALHFAHQQIELCRRPGGIFHPDAEREYGPVLMKHFALIHPFGADEITYYAEHGSPQAAAALEDIIVGKLDRNEPLGAVLGAYEIRRKNQANLPKRPGSKLAQNWVRDLGISLLGANLIERFGLAG